MQDEMAPAKAVPALLATQFLAAEVYSHFLFLSSESESDLWKKLLDDELDHIAHLRQLLNTDFPQGLTFPEINVPRMRDVCRQIRGKNDLFLMRLEGALRLECAELDYGLEGLVARKLERDELLPSYGGSVAEHVGRLMEEAKRYVESPNIGLQLSRLSELLDTCLAEGSTRKPGTRTGNMGAPMKL